MDFSVCRVLSNRKVSSGFFLLETTGTDSAKMGQFYMLRAWENYPLLSRPLSVFDSGGGKLSFVYKVAGQGTKIFSNLKKDDPVSLLGPLGNGFPAVTGNAALVGGGAGIAPLFLAAKQIKASDPGGRLEVFLGFSAEPFLVREFESAADRVITDVGGFITEKIDPAGYDHIFSCGPEAMMKALYEKCKAAGAGDRLHVSLENRMACGVGACFVCSRPAGSGNKKVCKDGPVFKAGEVFES
jgi:dihydroorotate dehydrogenase electron transfer subunit